MRSSRILSHHGTAAAAAVATARARPAQAAAAIADESGRSSQMFHETEADIPAVFADATTYERRSGVDRRSLARREERQKVWLDTRSGQDRRRQNRRASDQLSVVSLKI